MAETFQRRVYQARWVADKRTAKREAERIRAAWDEYVAKGEALAAITACASTCPEFAADVAPTVCQLLQGHPPGEEDGGHRHRILGSQVVLRW